MCDGGRPMSGIADSPGLPNLCLILIAASCALWPRLTLTPNPDARMALAFDRFWVQLGIWLLGETTFGCKGKSK